MKIAQLAHDLTHAFATQDQAYINATVRRIGLDSQISAEGRAILLGDALQGLARHHPDSARLAIACIPPSIPIGAFPY
ncbi:MAG: hypothetical protein WC043_07150 [Pseudobdellovibrionaceae bacterium]